MDEISLIVGALLAIGSDRAVELADAIESGRLELVRR